MILLYDSFTSAKAEVFISICRRIKSFIELLMDGGIDMQRDTDITRNIRIIEFLKSELLTSVASLYQILLKGKKASREVILDTLANIILVTYILGKRLGLTYSVIDSKLLDKIKIGKIEEHETEKWYGDLSDLFEYLKKDK